MSCGTAQTPTPCSFKVNCMEQRDHPASYCLNGCLGEHDKPPSLTKARLFLFLIFLAVGSRVSWRLYCIGPIVIAVVRSHVSPLWSSWPVLQTADFLNSSQSLAASRTNGGKEFPASDELRIYLFVLSRAQFRLLSYLLLFTAPLFLSSYPYLNSWCSRPSSVSPPLHRVSSNSIPPSHIDTDTPRG